MSARGRILVVSPYELEYGPPRTLEHVARAVVLAGHEPVCVVRPGARTTAGLRALDARIKVVDELSTFPRTLDPLRLASFVRQHMAAAEAIREIAVEEEAAMIYSISEAMLCGGIASRRLGLPSLVHVIGMSIKSPRWTARLYIKLLDEVTTQYVACSSAAAEMLESFGIEDGKITVAHNAIPIDQIDAAVPEQLALGRDGSRVGMVAAYDRRKGHELFVRAAAEIATVAPDARFYIVGGILETHPESVAFEREIRELIAARGLEDRFEQVGFVGVPEVYDWIAALDVVVVPSKTEAFAHVVLEAMALGKPVVATGIEGNLDAFVQGQSGLYVDADAASVAAAVLGLLGDPGLAKSLGEAARERARLFFDERVTLPAVAATIEEILEASPSPALAGVR